MTSERPNGAASMGLGLLAVVGAFTLSCASGPGSEFVKTGDDALKAGRASDALAAYDQAEEEGASETRLRSRRDEAASLLSLEKIAEADRLEAEGDHTGAMDLLIEAQALEPNSEELAEALLRHGQLWLDRAMLLAEEDKRAEALRVLDRLGSVYPAMPGLSNTRSMLTSEWTEILLNRARDAEKTDRTAAALINWAILAALNPEETFFAAELDPLRKELIDSLAVRTALFLGTMNAQVGLDPDVDRLRQVMGEALTDGKLSLEGVSWVERAYGEPGPSVTVAAVGEISSSDVERGEGIYRVLESTREIPNPELVEGTSRLAELDSDIAETSRLMDKYEVSLRHSEGPSRTKMNEALIRAQGDYDRLTAEAYDLGQKVQTMSPTVVEPSYTEYPVEDEVHSHRVEVTLEVRVSTGDDEAPSPSYLVGLGEEKDTLRIGDASRGIPDDPLVFTKTDDELRQEAVADALDKARSVIAVIPGQAGGQWLAHAQRLERTGDLDEASRAYIHHVLLMPDEVAEAALSFLAAQGLPSPSLIRGPRSPLP